MASIQRRAARSLIASSSRTRHLPITQIRHYAKAKEPERPQLSDEKDSPYLVGTPIFPIPRDPFAPAPARRLTPSNPSDLELQGSPPAEPTKEYSPTQKKWVLRMAKLMGYNTQASTAIRETQRMLGGIVEAIENDAEFWYGECQLPPTYQTFFQLHMFYLLMLIPRLRALPVNARSSTHPIPEPADPSAPEAPKVPPQSSPAVSPSTSSTPLFSKPTSSRYVTEMINIFFELAESQMRRALGRSERERVIQKYLKEFGEQFKGTMVGLDFILSLRFSQDAKERATADTELASWLWRNLFASRGLGPPSPEFVAPDEVDAYSVTELYMLPQIETILSYMRREMARLDSLSDRDVLDGNIGAWPKVKPE